MNSAQKAQQEISKQKLEYEEEEDQGKSKLRSIDEGCELKKGK